MRVMLKAGFLAATVFSVITALSQLSGARIQSPSPQTEPVPKGQIVEKVTCANDPEQTYALYVPSSYTRDRRWPILYALDPGARGKIGVEHFKEAAEKYGWIVAGSNNSRNGPIQQSAVAWNAMWTDTHQRFAIDDRRVYAAGFSGGARAAITIATACVDCVAGVIAGGAGFPVGVAPSSSTRFIFYGTIGVDDFNFLELKNLDDALTKAEVTHQIEAFVGRHEWAPAAVTVHAFEWMELKAMGSGLRARDENLINELWQKRTEQAQAFEGSKQPYEAYQIYLATANAFRSLRDLTETEKKIVALGAGREVRDALRGEEQQIKKQRELESQIYRLLSGRAGGRSLFADDNGGSGSTELQKSARAPADLNDQSSAENSPDAFAARNKLQTMFSDLQKSARATQDTSERRVARRVTEGVYIGLFEQGLNLLQTQKRYVAAANIFQLATELAPERAGAFYYLASAYALSREKKKSLQALKDAVEKGFSDLDALANNKAFDSVRNEPAYQQIIQRLSNGH